MTTITQFLLARIAEDEERARESEILGYFVYEDRYKAVLALNGSERLIDIEDPTERQERALRHLHRWEPARVLAECDAKRRIVEMHGWEVLEDDGEFIATSDCESCRTYPPCATIRALLDIYKNHPDAPDPYTQR